MFEAGHQITTVTVPDDLESRAVSLRTRIKPRSSSKSDSLDPVEAVRDLDTGLAIDSQEQLMFLLSNEVMREMAKAPCNTLSRLLFAILKFPPHMRFYYTPLWVLCLGMAGLVRGPRSEQTS